jgi:maltose alpha-D-glucosyltransferase/alpha-amylase
VIVHNLTGDAKPVHLHLQESATRGAGENVDELVKLLSDDHSHGDHGRYTIAMEPYAYRWYRVGGLDYLLQRSETH